MIIMLKIFEYTVLFPLIIIAICLAWLWFLSYVYSWVMGTN